VQQIQQPSSEVGLVPVTGLADGLADHGAASGIISGAPGSDTPSLYASRRTASGRPAPAPTRTRPERHDPTTRSHQPKSLRFTRNNSGDCQACVQGARAAWATGVCWAGWELAADQARAPGASLAQLSEQHAHIGGGQRNLTASQRPRR
jgi:hypothetical protein